MDENTPQGQMGKLSDLLAPIPPQPKNITYPQPFVPSKLSESERGLKPIRTYESDVASFVQVGNMSVSKIALAEQEKRRKQNTIERIPSAEETASKKKWVLVLVSLLFIAAGSVTLYSVFFKNKPLEPVRIGNTTIKTIVTADIQKEIDTTIIDSTKFREVLANERRNTTLPLGKILAPFPTTVSGGLKILTPVDQFIDSVGLHPGAQLVRSLDPEFMFGIHSFDGNQPFLILKTRSYQNAFAGMLEWEPRLFDDFKELFFDIPPGNIQPTVWSDTIFQNKDVRVLRDGTAIKILYSLIDKNTIVITTDEPTFKEILARIYTSQLVR